MLSPHGRTKLEHASEPDESANGINAAVSGIEAGIGNVAVAEFGVNRPGAFHPPACSNSCLQVEFKGRPNPELHAIGISRVRVESAEAHLVVGHKKSIRAGDE